MTLPSIFESYATGLVCLIQRTYFSSGNRQEQICEIVPACRLEFPVRSWHVCHMDLAKESYRLTRRACAALLILSSCAHRTPPGRAVRRGSRPVLLRSSPLLRDRTRHQRQSRLPRKEEQRFRRQFQKKSRPKPSRSSRSSAKDTSLTKPRVRLCSQEPDPRAFRDRGFMKMRSFSGAFAGR